MNRSFQFSQHFKQFGGRIPVTDCHGFIVGCFHDLIEAAFGALGTETLRVDHAVTCPDLVHAFSRTEGSQCLRRIDTHQEDHIAMIHLRLLTEAFGLVINDGL